jgi:hypothetical protein
MTKKTLGALMNSNTNFISTLAAKLRILRDTAATFVQRTNEAGEKVEICHKSVNLRDDLRSRSDAEADAKKALTSFKDYFNSGLTNIVKQDAASRTISVNVVIPTLNVNINVTPQVAVILRKVIKDNMMSMMGQQSDEVRLNSYEGVSGVFSVRAIDAKALAKLKDELTEAYTSIQVQLNTANYTLEVDM